MAETKKTPAKKTTTAKKATPAAPKAAETKIVNEEVKNTNIIKEEKKMSHEALGMIETRGLTAAVVAFLAVVVFFAAVFLVSAISVTAY